MVKTQSIYEKAAVDDGFRLLVMRRWPRGIAKGQVDGWDKELAPSLSLLEEWRAERLSWDEFARRYRDEMSSRGAAIAELARRAQEGNVALLCGCRDEARCHRSLLTDLMEGARLAG